MRVFGVGVLGPLVLAGGFGSLSLSSFSSNSSSFPACASTLLPTNIPSPPGLREFLPFVSKVFYLFSSLDKSSLSLSHTPLSPPDPISLPSVILYHYQAPPSLASLSSLSFRYNSILGFPPRFRFRIFPFPQVTSQTCIGYRPPPFGGGLVIPFLFPSFSFPLRVSLNTSLCFLRAPVSMLEL